MKITVSDEFATYLENKMKLEGLQNRYSVEEYLYITSILGNVTLAKVPAVTGMLPDLLKLYGEIKC